MEGPPKSAPQCRALGIRRPIILNGMEPMMITEPTRIQMRGFLITKSLIDVILTNHPELFENCGAHDPALSDHGLVYGFLNETVKHRKARL